MSYVNEQESVPLTKFSRKVVTKTKLFPLILENESFETDFLLIQQDLLGQY